MWINTIDFSYSLGFSKLCLMVEAKLQHNSLINIKGGSFSILLGLVKYWHQETVLSYIHAMSYLREALKKLHKEGHSKQYK